MPELAHDLDATPKTTTATPTIAPPSPVPAAPVPVAIGTLTVGHAEDRAEADADRMADVALGRLRRSTDGVADAHVHGPGCDHLRRSAAPTPIGTPVVGREGGALDSGTSDAIESARGSGAPMSGDVRRRMETAFGTDFSAVRVHDDDRSAQLNTAVSARAFTTGNDIFFGRGQYAPDSPGGERVLAHELAHVVKDSGRGARRTLDPTARAAIERGVERNAKIQRTWTLPWRKTPEQKAAAEQEQTRKDGGATLKELNGKVKKAGEQQQANREATGATLAGIVTKHKEDAAAEVAANHQAAGKGLADAVKAGKKNTQQGIEDAHATGATLGGIVGEHRNYGGVAGGMPSVAEEVGKPALAGTVVGAVTAGTHFGHAASGGSAALGGLLLGDTAMGIRKGLKMRDDGAEYGDEAMTELGNRKLKSQGVGFGGAAIGAASAGVGIAATKAGVASSMSQAGWTAAGKAGTVAGGAALATTGAALGIASGSAQVLQGVWRGGKAVMHLCRLAWGRAAKMLSARGTDWKQAIVSAERYKAAINALKVGLGVLGIVAGALFIVSNPVGWGIGIAAAVAGGVWAAVKIAAKVKDANDRRKAAEKIAKGEKPSEAFNDVTGGKKDDNGSAAKGAAPAKSGSGYSKPKSAKSAKAENRAKAVEQSDEVARMASSHARLAHELRMALRSGNKALVAGSLERAAADPEFDVGASLARDEDRELHDSMLLLSSINVEPEQALAESGQELIEKKLSKIEAM